MALRGDPAEGRPPSSARSDGLRYAQRTGRPAEGAHPDFCLGVGGYPEKHPEAPSLEADLAHLKRKVDAGASFVTTQLFFDNDAYYRFVDRCRAAGIAVPIVPGIMPVLSLNQIRRFTQIVRLGRCRRSSSGASKPPATVPRPSSSSASTGRSTRSATCSPAARPATISTFSTAPRAP